MEFNETLCDEKHKRIDDILEATTNRLNNHGDRIGVLEKRGERTDVRLDNLCDTLESLTSTIKWTVGLIMTSLVGFVFWYIQSL